MQPSTPPLPGGWGALRSTAAAAASCGGPQQEPDAEEERLVSRCREWIMQARLHWQSAQAIVLCPYIFLSLSDLCKLHASPVCQCCCCCRSPATAAATASAAHLPGSCREASSCTGAPLDAHQACQRQSLVCIGLASLPQRRLLRLLRLHTIAALAQLPAWMWVVWEWAAQEEAAAGLQEWHPQLQQFLLVLP